MAQNPYEVLGVPRTASDEDIKKAYRTLAKELHPDRNTDNPANTERFKRVSAAYALLGDEAKRSQFDRGEIDADGNPRGFSGAHAHGYKPHARSAGFEGDPFEMFTDLFSGGARPGGRPFGAEFGGQRTQARSARGQTINYGLDIPFDQAARGLPQRLTLRGGKTIEIKLPAGLTDGQQIRLTGQGAPGPGGVGDALVTLRIQPHPHLKRDGETVILDLPISLSEAVRGASIRVPTVDGPVMLAVPAGSTSGRQLRLRSRGFVRKDGGRGDQMVRLLVDLPSADDALRAFVDSWPGAGPAKRGFSEDA